MTFLLLAGLCFFLAAMIIFTQWAMSTVPMTVEIQSVWTAQNMGAPFAIIPDLTK